MTFQNEEGIPLVEVQEQEQAKPSYSRTLMAIFAAAVLAKRQIVHHGFEKYKYLNGKNMAGRFAIPGHGMAQDGTSLCHWIDSMKPLSSIALCDHALDSLIL